MNEGLRNTVFTGFNKHVVALDLNSGQVLWNWASPHAAPRYISLLLADDQHLIVSASVIPTVSIHLPASNGGSINFRDME